MKKDNKTFGERLKQFFIELLFYSGLSVLIWWFVLAVILGFLTGDPRLAGFMGRVMSPLVFFAIPLQIAMNKNIRFLLIVISLGASIINAIYQNITSLQILIIAFVVSLVLSIVAKKKEFE